MSESTGGRLSDEDIESVGGPSGSVDPLVDTDSKDAPGGDADTSDASDDTDSADADTTASADTTDSADSADTTDSADSADTTDALDTKTSGL